jgi:hypothetical protein
MKTLRIAIPAVVAALLLATTAFAQAPGLAAGGRVSAFNGQSVAPGPRVQPTPLFSIGGMPVGIWTRVPPSYDATANLSAAANPLP